MKPLIFIGLAILTTTITAQTVIQKPTICDSTEKITTALLNEEIKERPVWAGVNKVSQHTFLLLANNQTGTWTFLQIADKWSCILAMGDKFSLDSLESVLKSTK